MRIAVAGIAHETNTFSTLTTQIADFNVWRGEACVSGEMWDRLRQQGIDLAPTLMASAPPNGPVARDAYESLKTELLTRLQGVLPVDGVYLNLHGAMDVREIGDGEGDLVSAIRAVVGPDVPIAASLDLHGNLSPRFVSSVNVLTAYRTAPHRDTMETRERAITHLVRCIREDLRPVTAMIKLPLLLSGEWATTDAEPARALYAMLPEIENTPGCLDASLMIGCAWTDSPETGAAVLVVAERDRELAYQQAARLANAMWAQRNEFGPDVEIASVDEAIARALAAPESCVFLSDSGDNVTGGAAGDSPLFLERLLASDVPDAVVAGFADAEAAAQCEQAGIGATVTLSLGGKLDRQNARPFTITGKVTHLDTSVSPTIAGVQAAGVLVLLTPIRWPFTQLAVFQRVGVNPFDHKIVVVKLGYLFPELRDNAPRAIMALSPGFTALDLARLPYHNLPRPIYPLDPEMEWQANAP